MKCDQLLPEAAVRVGNELQQIRAVFNQADEVYRRLRAALFADPPPKDLVPVEWIPISDH